MNIFRKQVQDERRKGIVSGIPANDLDQLFRDTPVSQSDLNAMGAREKRDVLLAHWSDAEEAIFAWLDGARDD